jgi:hypothetical protein
MVKCARIWRPVSRAPEPRPPLNLAVFGLEFILRIEEATLSKRNEKLNRIEGTSKLFQRGECLGRRRPHGHMFPLGLAGGRTLVPKENPSVAPALNSRTTSMHRALFRSGQTAAQKWFQEVIAGARLWTDDSDKRSGKLGVALLASYNAPPTVLGIGPVKSGSR